MSSTRMGYTALATPDTIDFNMPYTTSSSSSPRLSRQTNVIQDSSIETDSYESLHGKRRRVRAIWSGMQNIARNNNGLLLVAASQVFFCLMNVVVKILNGIDPPVSTLELIVVRMGITSVCSITYMYWTGISDPILGPQGVRCLLIFRGMSGFFGLFGIYYSLVYLSLSDATVLTFLAPLCTTVAGSVFLGEKFAYREILAGLVSLFGVVLIARPAALFGQSSAEGTESATSEERLVAVGVALIGVLGATGAYISIRAVGTRAHAVHSVSFFSILCVIAGSAGMMLDQTPIIIPERMEWLTMLAMIGIFGFVAQFLLAMGLQRETAGRGTMAIYTQVIFAAILEKIFFHVLPSFLSVIGTLLIMGSAIYAVLIKESESAPISKSINLEDLSTVNAALEEVLLDPQDNQDDANPRRAALSRLH